MIIIMSNSSIFSIPLDEKYFFTTIVIKKSSKIHSELHQARNNSLVFRYSTATRYRFEERMQRVGPL